MKTSFIDLLRTTTTATRHIYLLITLLSLSPDFWLYRYRKSRVRLTKDVYIVHGRRTMVDKDLRERLAQDLDRVSIKPLTPHFERQALWLVAPEIDLVEAAFAVVTDDASSVTRWIENGDFRKPSKTEIDHWTNNVLAQHFEFIIVQPYVLAKLYQGGEADWRDQNPPKNLQN